MNGNRIEPIPGRSVQSEEHITETEKPEIPPATGAAGPEMPGAKPESKNWAKRLSSGLGIKYHKVTTIKPEDAKAAASKADTTWYAKDETVTRFWEMIFSFMETGLNMVCKAIGIPDMPPEIFQIDPGQEYIFRTALRGFTTKILRDVFLAKSPEDADRIVAGLTGVLAFGLMAFKIVTHFILHVPKSEKLKAWRARRQAAIRDRRSRELAAGKGETEPKSPNDSTIRIPSVSA